MKKILILSMVGIFALCSCSRPDDNQDLQREEAMNRGDMLDDDYQQKDVAPEGLPSNIRTPKRNAQ